MGDMHSIINKGNRGGNKNQHIFALGAIICIIFIGLAAWLKINANSVKKEIIPKANSKIEQSIPTVVVVMNREGNLATHSGVLAQTPYAALVEVAKRDGEQLETKQYDFGVFVTKVGVLETGNEMAWIVSVNGKSLDVASDKMTLSTGDLVEWAYKKSIY